MTKETKAKPVAAPKMLEGKEAIEAAITSIHNRGKKLDRDIWQAAISVLAHHNAHGDVTLVNKLVEAMPVGSRVNALREFIQQCGKVVYDEASKSFKHDKEGAFDLDKALAQCWTAYKPEQPYQPLDLVADIQKLLNKVQKRTDAGLTEQDKVDPQVLAGLTALVGMDPLTVPAQ